MTVKTAIEWTDFSWNPVTGCTEISPGCDHCYAKRHSERFRGVPGHPYEHGFDLTLRPERLQDPLHKKKPCMIFVNSMSDLFHKDIPEYYIHQIFDTMERADWHIYQVLTKRSSLMQHFVNRRYPALPCPAHIWLGVSVENAAAKSRIVHLQNTNAAMRFLSIEPLLESVGRLDLEGISWVIVGGESGPGFRAMKEAWATEVRDQCLASHVPFFFKQVGGPRPKSGGCLLEGVEWKQFPIYRQNGSPVNSLEYTRIARQSNAGCWRLRPD
jgi:protein gp37